jgi:hypothetical protein
MPKIKSSRAKAASIRQDGIPANDERERIRQISAEHFSEPYSTYSSQSGC